MIGHLPVISTVQPIKQNRGLILMLMQVCLRACKFKSIFKKYDFAKIVYERTKYIR